MEFTSRYTTRYLLSTPTITCPFEAARGSSPTNSAAVASSGSAAEVEVEEEEGGCFCLGFGCGCLEGENA